MLKTYKKTVFVKMKNYSYRLDNKRVLEQLQKDLRLSSKPRHIECFDNSNIQGTNPVAVWWSLKTLKPVKRTTVYLTSKRCQALMILPLREEVVYRR